MKYLSGKNINSAVAVWISFVFIQSGFFKFTNAPETQYIFSTVGQWMSDTIAPTLGDLMTQYGGYFIGGVEYIASTLLLIRVFHRLIKQERACDPLKTFVGALLAFGVISGAIFFHLFTPLGIEVEGDGGALFAMAVSVWFGSLLLLWENKKVVCKC